jgi:ABC-type lipoprotein export system ATPase subunit
MLPLILAGNEPEARDRAMYFLAILGLDSLAERLPDELSGGQAQRAAMARALIVRPRLILADEPTGQLDSVTSAIFLDTVLGLVDETRSALLIATHDPLVARRMSGTWTIEHGRLGPELAPRQ